MEERAEVYLILGGVRSGKSSYAAKLALELAEQPLYIATARSWDQDFQARIKRHRKARGPCWKTIEAEKYLSKIKIKEKIAVIDCVTLWLTNFFVDNGQNFDKTLQEVQHEFDQLIKLKNTFIIVSNEVGMSIHPATETGRKFADLQGFVNQYIAKKAKKVVLMVAGIPVSIKG